MASNVHTCFIILYSFDFTKGRHWRNPLATETAGKTPRGQAAAMLAIAQPLLSVNEGMRHKRHAPKGLPLSHRGIIRPNTETERRTMKLQQLIYAVKVAECGSITEASRKLFVSQPSITAAIGDLEREMDVRIFDRTNKGVIVSEEGETFLGYARQVLEQADLLESRYKGQPQQAPHFSVSCQHYSFAVNAFVDVIREFDSASYDFTIREEQTHEIIEDVAHMKSELGVLYLSARNRDVIGKMITANNLVFEPLFKADPHVFICSNHPLSKRTSVTLEDMADYPFLSYEQGSYNSFYYSEELTTTLDRSKNIRVRDRATLFNLLIGLNGYTVCSGVISAELNGASIISVPLEIDEYMEIGVIFRKGTQRTRYGSAYLEALKRHIS